MQLVLQEGAAVAIRRWEIHLAQVPLPITFLLGAAALDLFAAAIENTPPGARTEYRQHK